MLISILLPSRGEGKVSEPASGIFLILQKLNFPLTVFFMTGIVCTARTEFDHGCKLSGYSVAEIETNVTRIGGFVCRKTKESPMPHWPP